MLHLSSNVLLSEGPFFLSSDVLSKVTLRQSDVVSTQSSLVSLKKHCVDPKWRCIDPKQCCNDPKRGCIDPKRRCISPTLLDYLPKTILKSEKCRRLILNPAACTTAAFRLTGPLTHWQAKIMHLLWIIKSAHDTSPNNTSPPNLGEAATQTMPSWHRITSRRDKIKPIITPIQTYTAITVSSSLSSAWTRGTIIVTEAVLRPHCGTVVADRLLKQEVGLVTEKRDPQQLI